MRSLRILLAIALVATAFSCNNRQSSGASYSFSRPELLEFLCFGRDATSTDYYVLPRRCCVQLDASGTAAPPAGCNKAAKIGGGEVGGLTPTLHGLLSQSTRGEIASIDLARKDVLDITRVVPGETFRDSGGLPVAIVTPRRQPRLREERGPEWTYVASAENLEVSALPNTCFRFREVGVSITGQPVVCGGGRQRVSLPGVPGDMILAPEGSPDEALWVTLPEQGLIARIELGLTPEQPFAQTAIRYYRVSPAPAALLPEPVLETPEYVTTCGLGTEFVSTELTLPPAPRAPATSAVRPTRLQYDAASELLLVADGVAPVLHAYAFGADASLIELSALATGMPVREFVLTAPVPATASPDPQVPLLPRPVDPALPETALKRYLYAIEEGGEGLVMAFEFAAPVRAGQPRLTPLALRASHSRYRDRLRVRSPAVALTVIDTRDLDPKDEDASGSSYVCGGERPPGEKLDANYVTARRERRNELRDTPANPQRDAELAALEAQLSIAEDAGPRQLRGVFLVAAVADGQLTILDVHDLDVACRAAEICRAENLALPVEDDTREAVAIRRHAPRLAAVGKIEATVLGTEARALVPVECQADERAALIVENAAGACVPRDPWQQINDTWTIDKRGALAEFPGSALEFPGQPLGEVSRVPSPVGAQVTLHAPRGFNLCTSGVQNGDLVAFVGAPSARTKGCETPSDTTARTLKILEAFDDGLVLGPHDELMDPAANERAHQETLEALRRCYPDSVQVALRGEDYVVRLTGNNAAGGQRHRIVAGSDGRCVVDESRDARLTIRTVAEPNAEARVLSYRGPNLRFTFKKPADDSATTSYFDLQIRSAPTTLGTTNANARELDALPVRLRYLPDDQSLFAVDTASQGLRRYTLTPFEWDEDSIYR